MIKVIEGINGGIRTAHLHLEKEIVFLSEDRFRSLVGMAAERIGKDLGRM